MKKNKQIKPRGGAHNVKPPEKKRVPISVALDPETVKLLEPYTKASQRGRIIDEAVKAYLAAKD